MRRFVYLFFLTVSAQALEPSFEQAPINYSESEAVTPITKIRDRITDGEKLLDGKTEQEVLGQLLDLLKIPVESQILVYSKTSAQNEHISPRTPRAIYFSDNAYVAWVQGGSIETMTFDEKLGAVFHLVKITERKTGQPITISRERSCLNCHAGSSTRNFPGGLVRSVFPSESGQPLFHAGTFRTKPSSPISERWGGWYVTGSSGEQEHLGNILATESEDREVSFEKIAPEPIQDFSAFFNAENYPAKSSSDIVALMVIEHQIEAHNVFVQANLVAQQTLHRHREMKNAFGESTDDELSETNRRVLEGQVDNIISAILFADEFSMGDDGVDGAIAFQQAFQKNSRKNKEHRSLKDFRLLERLFKYRCSYTIYSDPFTHLPEKLKTMVYRKLADILENGEKWPDYAYLTSSERRRILSILDETLPSWRNPKEN